MVLSAEEGYRYVQLESSKTTDYLLLWVHNAREKVFEVPSTIIRMRKRESGEGRAPRDALTATSKTLTASRTIIPFPLSYFLSYFVLPCNCDNYRLIYLYERCPNSTRGGELNQTCRFAPWFARLKFHADISAFTYVRPITGTG